MHRTAARTLATWLALTAGASMIHAAGAEPQVLRGQLTCSSCWFEADRARVPYGTPEDVACAARCAKDGVPPALAVREADGTFTLYRLEARKVDLTREGWLPLIGRQLELRGSVTTRGKHPKILVDEKVELEPAKPVAAALQDPIELQLPDLDGVSQRLSALRGRVVVLNFWATWCKPCRDEMPLLAEIQTRYAARGVQVVGAGADAAADAARVGRFASDVGVNFPLWLGATTEQMERLGLPPLLPGTIVIDRSGRPVEHLAGKLREQALVEAIERALGVPAQRTATEPLDVAPVEIAQHPSREVGSRVPS